MTGATDLERDIGALETGRAFTDLSSWRLIRVDGADARRWLGDLVTADVASIESEACRRSLLLGPTGRIRADMWIVAERNGFILLQPPDQPDPVDALLAPYTLSSDVRLQDQSNDRALLAVDGTVGRIAGTSASRPSVLGSGANLTTSRSEVGTIREALIDRGPAEADPRAVEVLRIRRGTPRMGADFDTESLPAEAGLEEVVDFTKGCFLGQESVAKVRNLGHPPRVLRHLLARAAVSSFDPVLAGSGQAGRVTSAAPGREEGTTALLARVRWEAADSELTLADGSPLVPLA